VLDPVRPLDRIYIDGSASGPQSAPPRLPDWSLTILSPDRLEPYSNQYGPVIMVSSDRGVTSHQQYR